MIMGVTLSIGIIALITVIARVYLRFFMVRAAGWDVSFMLPTLLSALTFLGLHDAGRHGSG